MKKLEDAKLATQIELSSLETDQQTVRQSLNFASLTSKQLDEKGALIEKHSVSGIPHSQYVIFFSLSFLIII